MSKNGVILVDIMHTVDLKRIMGDTQTTEQKILAVINVCKQATSEWAKNYWFDVFVKLCKKYDRMDLYNKHLH